jgi:hypothetical protein
MSQEEKRMWLDEVHRRQQRIDMLENGGFYPRMKAYEFGVQQK